MELNTDGLKVEIVANGLKKSFMKGEFIIEERLNKVVISSLERKSLTFDFLTTNVTINGESSFASLSKVYEKLQSVLFVAESGQSGSVEVIEVDAASFDLGEVGAGASKVFLKRKSGLVEATTIEGVAGGNVIIGILDFTFHRFVLLSNTWHKLLA